MVIDHHRESPESEVFQVATFLDYHTTILYASPVSLTTAVFLARHLTTSSVHIVDVIIIIMVIRFILHIIWKYLTRNSS
jgi:hypothetical protein